MKKQTNVSVMILEFSSCMGSSYNKFGKFSRAGGSGKKTAPSLGPGPTPPTTTTSVVQKESKVVCLHSSVIILLACVSLVIIFCVLIKRILLSLF